MNLQVVRHMKQFSSKYFLPIAVSILFVLVISGCSESDDEGGTGGSTTYETFEQMVDAINPSPTFREELLSYKAVEDVEGVYGWLGHNVPLSGTYDYVPFSTYPTVRGAITINVVDPQTRKARFSNEDYSTGSSGDGVSHQAFWGVKEFSGSVLKVMVISIEIIRDSSDTPLYRSGRVMRGYISDAPFRGGGHSGDAPRYSGTSSLFLGNMSQWTLEAYDPEYESLVGSVYRVNDFYLVR